MTTMTSICPKHPRSRQIYWPRTNCPDCVTIHLLKYAQEVEPCGCARLGSGYYLFCKKCVPQCFL